MSIVSFTANSESVKPTFDVKLERPVSVAVIDGTIYHDVLVEIDSRDPLFGESGVKVTVKDYHGGNTKSGKINKKLYKKRFSYAHVYAFSDGTIQVGKGDAVTYLVLYEVGGEWRLRMREGGLY